MQIQEFNDLYKLHDVKDAWDDLLAKTEGADFFRTLSWLEVYWKHYGQNQKLRVLVFKQQGEVVGILPVSVARRRTKLGRFRTLEFPLDFWGSFYGPVGPGAKGILRAGLQHLLDTPRDWDHWDLRWLDDSASGGPALAGAAEELQLKMLKRDDDQIAIADLRNGWDAYWSSRSRNWRSNCRRNVKKTEAAGEVEYVRYRPRGERHGDADPRWDLYDDVQGIACSSWQARSQDGTTMSHESIGRFLRDVHVAAAREGCLDLNLLRIDGRPVAFNYNYQFRGYVSSLRLGFDPQFASSGVGTVLSLRMLEDSCRRGDQTVDFLPGSLAVKRPWQTSLKQTVRYEFIPFRLGRLELKRVKRWITDRWQSTRQALSPAACFA